MAEIKIYKGDIGTEIRLNTGVDLQSAVVSIYYKKPSGTTGYWSSTVDDSTYVLYTIQDGDLDEAGEWTLQTYVELLSGWKGHGEIVSMMVWEPITLEES